MEELGKAEKEEEVWKQIHLDQKMKARAFSSPEIIQNNIPQTEIQKVEDIIPS